MKFKVPRRNGKFGKVNIRHEKHGTENVPASDVKFEFKGTKTTLNMLCPLASGEKFSDTVWDDRGNLQMPYLSPMSNFRTPENVTFTVWDKPTREKDPLSFTETRIKSIEIELNDNYNIVVRGLIQIHDDPEKHSVRLRQLMDTERQFSLEAAQEDFFDKEPEDNEEEDSPQGSLTVTTEQDDPDEDDDE